MQVIDPDSGLARRGRGRLGAHGRARDDRRGHARRGRRSQQLEGRSIVVTAGPTRERIDPVRYLSNRSSGKMGYALAAAAARRGARVTLISGPVRLAPPFGVECIPVETSTQMREAVLQARREAAAVFMAAAVSDYVPQVAASKIKRSGSPLVLTLDEGPDILSELGATRQEKLLVGFRRRDGRSRSNARAKLERKNLDFIVANDVSRPDSGFEVDHNQVTILGRGGERWEVAPASKAEVAEAILDRVLAPPVGQEMRHDERPPL